MRAPLHLFTHREPRATLPALALGALGVVFGDIGTSPLYAFKACFSKQVGLAPTQEHVLGLCATIFWVLVGVVCFKYVGLVLRADHDGEGGTLALLALLADHVKERVTQPPTMLALLVLVGSAMLYGDGVITPAISVLSAVEGLNVATPSLQPYVLPIALGLLFGLFSLQSRGTGRIGTAFGPVMVLWFAALAAIGIASIIRQPRVLAALDPLLVVRFFATGGHAAFLVLGAVVLTVTGVEALYADLAHFGRDPIAWSWYVLVFPALVLSYLGQGALALTDPRTIDVGFFAAVPHVALYPMVALATAATIIASQALISGVFSLTQQAIQLAYCPPLRAVHTSATMGGQIYMPFVNVLLGIACVGVAAAFRSSDRLTAAYGIAVTVTMFVTSITYFVVARRVFGWPRLRAAAVLATFLLFDLSFVAAGIPKIAQGGWVPLMICACVFVLFTTWTYGRLRLGEVLTAKAMPIPAFLREIRSEDPIHLERTAVFIAPDAEDIPFVMRSQWLRDRASYELAILLSMSIERVPYIEGKARIELSQIAPALVRVVGHCGFMQDPDAPEVLRHSNLESRGQSSEKLAYYMPAPHFTKRREKAMPQWQRVLYAFMYRNAIPYSDYLRIPPDEIVHIGVEVPL